MNLINEDILIIKNSFYVAWKLLEDFFNDEENLLAVEKAIATMCFSIKEGRKVISCGNGGSMCDAIHFAEELTGRFHKDRPALPAIAISDPAHLSCTSNDYGYEHVFARWLEALASSGDVLLAISTSGNSKNVIRAVEVAKKKGLKTIGLLGKNGGELKGLVDIPIVIKSDLAERVQEMHIKIIHVMVEGIEREIFFRD
ncbi:MAG: D-sedoheptulose 7-phosphate isomerase [Oligoflexia bacterium]|nr:D-sedoheptulose 7-phosphate isomerase [Oligoflexia bacterium]